MKLAIFRNAGTAGMPMICLHAFPLHSTIWKNPHIDLYPQLCVSLDQRGFGASEPGEDPMGQISVLADDVAESIRHLGFDRCIIAGCSIGGYIAFELWRRHPEIIGGLVLADTRAEADSDETRIRRKAMADRVRSEGCEFLGDFVEENLLSLRTRETRPHVVREVRQLATSASPAAVIQSLEILANRPDSTATLPTINVPTLVVVGQHDSVTPPDLAQTMANSIPGAEFSIIPDAGHISPMENPEGFRAAVSPFLRRLRGENP